MWLKGKGLQTWSLPPPSAGPPLRGAYRWDTVESLDISSDTPTARSHPLHIETKWGMGPCAPLPRVPQAAPPQLVQLPDA